MNIDMDLELTALSKLQNEFEQNVTFTKRGLMDLINDLLKREQEETKLWEQKLNKDNVRIWLKKGGSEHD